MAGWGIPRNTGRIYAYLLLQHDPATLDDMVDTLGIAKSGASVAARQLAQLGLARAAGQAGTRRVRYEALYNLELMFAARTQQMRDLVTRLRQGARAAPAGQGRRRLHSMAAWCDDLINEFPRLVRRLERRQER